MAHKAEHAVDLDTGAVVAVTIQEADEGDTATNVETIHGHPTSATKSGSEGWLRVLRALVRGLVTIALHRLGVRDYVFSALCLDSFSLPLSFY